MFQEKGTNKKTSKRASNQATKRSKILKSTPTENVSTAVAVATSGKVDGSIFDF